MSSARPYALRKFPHGDEEGFTVRITHGVLGNDPCVVFEQDNSAFGGLLFSVFETVAQLYEFELDIWGQHPGARLRLVQYRQRALEAGPQGLYEEVIMRGPRHQRYAVKWLPVTERIRFSASSPIPGFLAVKPNR